MTDHLRQVPLYTYIHNAHIPLPQDTVRQYTGLYICLYVIRMYVHCWKPYVYPRLYWWVCKHTTHSNAVECVGKAVVCVLWSWVLEGPPLPVSDLVPWMPQWMEHPPPCTSLIAELRGHATVIALDRSTSQWTSVLCPQLYRSDPLCKRTGPPIAVY